MDTINTRNVGIRRLGFGIFRRHARLPGGSGRPVAASAHALGYRHLDTAAMYENAVAAAIASSSIPRSELFVTPESWHDHAGTKDAIRRAFDTSIGGTAATGTR